MSLWLAGDRGFDRGVQRAVGEAFAQRRAQIGGVFLAEAHVECSRAGDAHAVAALAEIVRQGRDEANSPACFPGSHVAGGATRAVVDLFERKFLGEARAHLG